MKPRRQKDQARDAALTRSFHAMLSRLKEPARPPDGVRGPLGIVGWVQVDVRFLKRRRGASA
jgi:hypothetical protein